MNKEKVIAAFFIAFCMIGMASFLFIYDVIGPQDKRVTISYPITKNEKKPRGKIFNAQYYKLENGLQIVVIENHRAPVLTHMVWYRVGAADEKPGKSGIAHFLEHLMFKGHSTELLGSMGPGDFSNTIRALGGEDNAFTSYDYTAYFQSIASEHLETVMTMEAARMRGLNPPLEDVASENKVILEERLQRTDNDPRAQMREQMNNVLFPNHPYGTPIIGWYHEMEQLSWADAKEFYDAHYAPNNAILIVSGDVTGEDVFQIAQNTYGLIDSVETPERQWTKSPPFLAKPSVTLRHKTIKEPFIHREYRAPSFRQDKKKSLAIQVLAEIMSGGSSSRLYKTLVVEQKVASNINLSYSSASWDDSTVTIMATVPEADNIDAVQEAINDQLTDIIMNGVEKNELKEAKKRMQAEAIYARDSLSGPAMIIGYNMVTGSSLDDIEYWPSYIEEVTAAEITDVARTYLNPESQYTSPPVFGLLLPTEVEETIEETAEETGE